MRQLRMDCKGHIILLDRFFQTDIGYLCKHQRSICSDISSHMRILCRMCITSSEYNFHCCRCNRRRIWCCSTDQQSHTIRFCIAASMGTDHQYNNSRHQVCIFHLGIFRWDRLFGHRDRYTFPICILFQNCSWNQLYISSQPHTGFLYKLFLTGSQQLNRS